MWNTARDHHCDCEHYHASDDVPVLIGEIKNRNRMIRSKDENGNFLSGDVRGVSVFFV